MFQGLAAEGIDGMLRQLEAQLPLLAEADQAFVRGCRLHLEAGAPLTEQNQQEIQRIAGTLVHTDHNTLGGALSMAQVLKDLGGAVHTLDPQEKAFANQMAGKIQNRLQLTQGEITQLLQIYSSKGF